MDGSSVADITNRPSQANYANCPSEAIYANCPSEAISTLHPSETFDMDWLSEGDDTSLVRLMLQTALMKQKNTYQFCEISIRVKFVLWWQLLLGYILVFTKFAF